MQLFVCSVYITNTGQTWQVKHGKRTLFNILMVHFVVKFQFCLTCISGSLSPFGCYYCQATFLNFTEANLHATSSHDSLVLKVRSLEFNSSTSKIGYRSHNFNVKPKELKSAGQSIQADPSDNKLFIRITRTGGDEITISSPTIKKNRQCTSPQPSGKQI